MISHAQTDRSWVISYHVQDIGGYRSMVGYICYRGKEPWGNVTERRTKSMRRLAHVILSVLIKDHTIIGTSVQIERMPLTQLAG